MTKEERRLLIKDLSARYPYGCKVYYKYNGSVTVPLSLATIKLAEALPIGEKDSDLIELKPYLRSIKKIGIKCSLWGDDIANVVDNIQYLLEHHYDMFGLIEKGLALEAPEDMYTDDGVENIVDNFSQKNT